MRELQARALSSTAGRNRAMRATCTVARSAPRTHVRRGGYPHCGRSPHPWAALGPDCIEEEDSPHVGAVFEHVEVVLIPTDWCAFEDQPGSRRCCSRQFWTAISSRCFSKAERASGLATFSAAPTTSTLNVTGRPSSRSTQAIAKAKRIRWRQHRRFLCESADGLRTTAQAECRSRPSD
jgi:hypothetical protein